MQVHPEIARLTIASKLDGCMVLWTALREWTKTNRGSSHFSRRDVHKIIAQHQRVTKRQVRNWITQGTGIFWGVDAQRIYMRSTKRVATALSLELPGASVINISSMREIHIPVAKFDGSNHRRAWLYWSWFAAQKETTISRDTISDLFQLSHDQQRAYEALLDGHLHVKSNYGYLDHSRHDFKAQMDKIPLSHAYTRQCERTLPDGSTQSYTATFWQLPNTYSVSTDHRHYSISASNRVNAVLRASWDTNPAEILRRVYCRDLKQYLRSGDAFKALIRVYWNGSKRLWITGNNY